MIYAEETNFVSLFRFLLLNIFPYSVKTVI